MKFDGAKFAQNCIHRPLSDSDIYLWHRFEEQSRLEEMSNDDTLEIAEIFPPNGEQQRIYCVECEAHSDIAFTDFKEVITGVDITIAGLPVLKCPDCGAENLPDTSRLAIIEIHKKAIERGRPIVKCQRKKRNEEFGFTKVPFDYDPDDYFYFPGLVRPFDIGFLQPVFFNRMALLKYENSPDYEVQFASTTYGTIYSDGNSISFGINRFGNLVMWLGDIAKLPENEQYYLRSENVASDHSIGSEFYDGQIEVKFTDLSAEDTLFGARSEFLNSAASFFGSSIAHLEGATYDLALNFNPPLVDTPKERRHIADTLNKIYIESLDNKVLKALLAERNITSKGSGQLKRLEALIQGSFPAADVSALVSPLYVLSDFRNIASHTGSVSNQETAIFIADRLGVNHDSDLTTIYDALMKRLTDMFVQLNDLLKQNSD